MKQADCPFCNLPRERIWRETDASIAFLDGYPVTEGHALVIPKRHVASLFELPHDEMLHMWEQVGVVRRLLAEQHKPDGFNVGVNDGQAAGQTVPHAHIHLIPRRNGDVPDARGGVRWLIPAKAKYW